MDLNELRRERAACITEARAILDKADEEYKAKKRDSADLSGEEETRYQALDDQADELDKRVKREIKQQENERGLAESQKPPAAKGDPKDAGEDRSEPRTIEYRGYKIPVPADADAVLARAGFQHFLAEGRSGLSAEESRALQMSSNVAGGYVVAPEEFMAVLLKAVDDATIIRRIATVLPPLTSAASLGVPTLDADPADADWTSEIGTGSEDTAMKFGKRELHPHPLAKRLKVSKTLLSRAALGVEALVRDRLAYKLAVPQEKAHLTGSGANQALGVFTASADGISTGRDVDVGNDAVTADGIIDVKHALKPQYWGRARWVLHRDVLKAVRKLKDSQLQYLWQPGLQSDIPNSLLDLPYELAEFAPNTITQGNYVAVLGDFGFYWIVDALDMTIQRLDELYAETNQTGFISRLETDGMPVMEEAFVRAVIS